jgi:A/G-specific adenine glycosylase
MTGLREIRRKLLSWYRREGRDLPWRRTGDPYSIWVSEIMLQQTRVGTVIEYYDRFLERFPDVQSLAAADVDEVLAAWSGLGYYRRARAMHEAAREVVERHGGRFPSDPEALLQLPGIGRYTAGAISSICFDLAEPVLDGNVRRVLSRLTASPAPNDRELWETAAELAKGKSPGDLNQAVMELGAVICTPRNPECERCPVSAYCEAFASGNPEDYPAKRAVGKITDVAGAVALVFRGESYLLEKPVDGSLLRGTWDLPSLEIPDGEDAAAMVQRTLGKRHGIEVRTREPRTSMTHGIMNRRYRLQVVPCTHVRGKIAGREMLRWATVQELETVPVSGATRKVLFRSGSK